MFRLLIDFLRHVEEPPDRIGVIGFCIMAAFLLFCGAVWCSIPLPT
jgi:hypothetical protein